MSEARRDNGTADESVLPKLVYSPAPEYPPELRSKNVQGEALVDFIVTKDGNVARLVVVKTTHPLFGEAALRAVHNWKYAPATIDGEPINLWMQQSISFDLEDVPANK